MWAFSLKGSDLVLDVIKNKQYDPKVSSPLEMLIAVYVYHGKDIEPLLELEEEVIKYDKEVWAEDPVYQMKEQVKEK